MNKFGFTGSSWFLFELVITSFSARLIKKQLLKSSPILMRTFLSSELKALAARAYPPPPKVKSKAAPKSAAGGVNAALGSDEVTPARLDFRVGKIVSVAKHPDAGRTGFVLGPPVPCSSDTRLSRFIFGSPKRR